MQLQLGFAVLSIALFAGHGGAETLGRLTCAGPVRLAGAVLPVEGIPSWPVVRGDSIETLGQPAFLVLRDRTRVVLAERSRVLVSSDGARLEVRLLDGEIGYRLSPESATVFFDGEVELPAQAATEATVRAGNGRVDPPNGPPGTKPPPHERSRSASAPGHNK